MPKITPPNDGDPIHVTQHGYRDGEEQLVYPLSKQPPISGDKLVVSFDGELKPFVTKACPPKAGDPVLILWDYDMQPVAVVPCYDVFECPELTDGQDAFPVFFCYFIPGELIMGDIFLTCYESDVLLYEIDEFDDAWGYPVASYLPYYSTAPMGVGACGWVFGAYNLEETDPVLLDTDIQFLVYVMDTYSTSCCDEYASCAIVARNGDRARIYFIDLFWDEYNNFLAAINNTRYREAEAFVVESPCHASTYTSTSRLYGVPLPKVLLHVKDSFVLTPSGVVLRADLTPCLYRHGATGESSSSSDVDPEGAEDNREGEYTTHPSAVEVYNGFRCEVVTPGPFGTAEVSVTPMHDWRAVEGVESRVVTLNHGEFFPSEKYPELGVSLHNMADPENFRLGYTFFIGIRCNQSVPDLTLRGRAATAAPTCAIHREYGIDWNTGVWGNHPVISVQTVATIADIEAALNLPAAPDQTGYLITCTKSGGLGTSEFEITPYGVLATIDPGTTVWKPSSYNGSYALVRDTVINLSVRLTRASGYWGGIPESSVGTVCDFDAYATGSRAISHPLIEDGIIPRNQEMLWALPGFGLKSNPCQKGEYRFEGTWGTDRFLYACVEDGQWVQTTLRESTTAYSPGRYGANTDGDISACMRAVAEAEEEENGGEEISFMDMLREAFDAWYPGDPYVAGECFMDAGLACYYNGGTFARYTMKHRQGEPEHNQISEGFSQLNSCFSGICCACEWFPDEASWLQNPDRRLWYPSSVCSHADWDSCVDTDICNPYSYCDDDSVNGLIGNNFEFEAEWPLILPNAPGLDALWITAAFASQPLLQLLDEFLTCDLLSWSNEAYSPITLINDGALSVADGWNPEILGEFHNKFTFYIDDNYRAVFQSELAPGYGEQALVDGGQNVGTRITTPWLWVEEGEGFGTTGSIFSLPMLAGLRESYIVRGDLALEASDSMIECDPPVADSGTWVTAFTVFAEPWGLITFRSGSDITQLPTSDSNDAKYRIYCVEPGSPAYPEDGPAVFAVEPVGLLADLDPGITYFSPTGGYQIVRTSLFPVRVKVEPGPPSSVYPYYSPTFDQEDPEVEAYRVSTAEPCEFRVWRSEESQRTDLGYPNAFYTGMTAGMWGVGVYYGDWYSLYAHNDLFVAYGNQWDGYGIQGPFILSLDFSPWGGEMPRRHRFDNPREILCSTPLIPSPLAVAEQYTIDRCPESVRLEVTGFAGMEHSFQLCKNYGEVKKEDGGGSIQTDWEEVRTYELNRWQAVTAPLAGIVPTAEINIYAGTARVPAAAYRMSSEVRELHGFPHDAGAMDDDLTGVKDGTKNCGAFELEDSVKNWFFWVVEFHGEFYEKTAIEPSDIFIDSRNEGEGDDLSEAVVLRKFVFDHYEISGRNTDDEVGTTVAGVLDRRSNPCLVNNSVTVGPAPGISFAVSGIPYTEVQDLYVREYEFIYVGEELGDWSEGETGYHYNFVYTPGEGDHDRIPLEDQDGRPLWRLVPNDPLHTQTYEGTQPAMGIVITLDDFECDLAESSSSSSSEAGPQED